MKYDCDKLDTIHNNTELANYNYKVVQTLNIGSSGNSITVPNNEKLVFRATDEINIIGEFELPLGSELELITHPCPQ